MIKLFQNRSNKFWWVVLGVVILVILVLAYQNIFNTDTRVFQSEVNWLARVTHGLPMYPPETHYVDGTTLVYMPLYFLIVGNLMKVFSSSPIVGKVVSILSAVVISVCIYWISCKLTNRRVASLLPASLFLLYPVTVDFAATQMKIDLLGLMFCTVGLVFLLRKRTILAAFFMTLAISTKQMYVSLPIATGIYFLIKDRKRLAVFVGSLIVFAGGGFALGQTWTNGTFFTHVVTFLFNQPGFGKMEFSRTIGSALVNLAYLSPVLILAGYGIWKTKYLGLIGLYLVVSLVVMLYMGGKIGSGTNYTFDSLVAACCLSTLVLGVRNAEQRSNA